MATTRATARRRPRPRRAGTLPPPASEPQGADVTGEKLLQATHELLCESGGREPSVSEICARADVRQAMVSYCFGGKAQLLDALFGRAFAGIMDEQRQLAARGLPPEEALAVQVEAVVRNLVRFPYVNGLSQRIAQGGESVSRMPETFVAPTVAFYREVLDAGVREGVFRPVDPTLLLFSVVGMSDFVFSARAWLEDAGERLDEAFIERFAAHTVEMVLRGVAAAGPQRAGGATGRR